jgi:heme-degrading monooxygenase HmoA
MILEVAVLDIKPGLSADFEDVFQVAKNIISAMPGYISHELQHCLEKDDRYILLVRWQTLENHTIGFRQSPQYQEWRALLHHFYDPFPVVEHYQIVMGV